MNLAKMLSASRTLMVVVLALMAASLLRGGDVAPAQSQPATSLASPISAAILTPEILADLPAADRKTLAGTLDSLLAESLAAQKNFTAIDRQALDKVLNEHTAAASVTKAAANEVAESLRPFWSAGVIISPAIRIDPDPASNSQTATVIVDAVSSQTGQLLAECIARNDWKPGQPPPTLQAAQLEEFWSQIRRNLSQAAGRPLVEVSAGRLTSPLPRLAWMLDDLDDHLRTHIAASTSVTLLVPRHPLLTKEERLLRVMGLAVVKEGDPSAGLMASPEGRVFAELIEEPGQRLAFGKTPITFRLTWTHDGKSAAAAPIKGTVDNYETLRALSAAWLDQQLAPLALNHPDVQRDEAACKQLALQELAAVDQMLTPITVALLSAFASEPGENAMGARAFIHAARAAHLDPTNRQAARLVAALAHCPYFRPGQNQWSLTAYDRAIVETQRYIQRFNVTASEDDKIYYRLVWAGERAAEREAGSRERMTNLTLTPMESIYRYTRLSAHAGLEVGMVRALEGSGPMKIGTAHLWSGAFRLRDWVLLNCPSDELDAELAYWKKFWTERVEKIPNDAPPWEMILSGYYTRQGDYLSLRKTYADLAVKCPIPNSRVWASAKVDIHLKVAGDPDWKTWQVPFPQDALPQYRLEIRQSDAFFRRLIPQPISEPQSLYPYDCRRLIFAAETIGTGYTSSSDCAWIEALAITDGDIWFVTPSKGARTPAGGAKLFVCPLADITSPDSGKDIRPKPQPVAWPPQAAASTQPDSPVPPLVKCATVTHTPPGDSATLWIGTLGSGLARFDRADGKWQGRWYRGRQGLPVDNIYWIAPCRYLGKDQLLMLGTSAAVPPKGPVVWIFDPTSGESKILHEDLSTPDSAPLALAFPDGRKLPISIDDARVFPDLDLKDATVVTNYAAPHFITMPAEKSAGNPRIWLINSPDGGELNSRTFAPLTPPAPRPGPDQYDCLFIEKNPGGFNLRMPSASIAYFRPTNTNPNPFALPRRGVCHDRTFWLIDNRGFQLWGYTPADPGDKNWADHDRWIGPFVANGGGQLLSLLADSTGHLFVSTSEFIDILDPAALVKTAEKADRIHTTNQFKQKLQAQSVMPGWQGQTARALLDKRFADALAVIDDQLAHLGPVNENSPAARQLLWEDLMLWQALVQTRAGYLDEATDLYHQISASPLADAPAKAIARLNAIATLYRAQRWQDTLDEAQAFGRQFPDLKITPGNDSPFDPLPAQLADAAKRRQQATTNPALQPTDTHAPRRAAAVTPPADTRPAATDPAIGLRLIADCKTNITTAVTGARTAGRDAIPGLLQGLKSSDAPTRKAAATLLRILANEGRNASTTTPSALQLATEKTIDDLTAAAQDDPAVAEEAFVAADTFGPLAKPMVPLMLRTLTNEQASPHLRFLATMITRVSPDEPGLVDLFMANAHHANGTVRSSAISALAALGKRSIAAKPLLVAALKDPDPTTRSFAAMAIRGIGLPPDEQVTLLAPLTKDPDEKIRVNVIYNLGTLGPSGKAALPALLEALKDPEKWVQETAIQALGKMGKAAMPMIPELQRFQDPAIDPHIQKSADYAINAIERSEE